MTKATKNNIKRWIISSIVTFLAGFALVMYNQIDSITLDSFRDGTFIGLLFMAFRAGFKGILEVFLMTVKNK